MKQYKFTAQSPSGKPITGTHAHPFEVIFSVFARDKKSDEWELYFQEYMLSAAMTSVYYTGKNLRRNQFLTEVLFEPTELAAQLIAVLTARTNEIDGVTLRPLNIEGTADQCCEKIKELFRLLVTHTIIGRREQLKPIKKDKLR